MVFFMLGNRFRWCVGSCFNPRHVYGRRWLLPLRGRSGAGEVLSCQMRVQVIINLARKSCKRFHWELTHESKGLCRFYNRDELKSESWAVGSVTLPMKSIAPPSSSGMKNMDWRLVVNSDWDVWNSSWHMLAPKKSILDYVCRCGDLTHS